MLCRKNNIISYQNKIGNYNFSHKVFYYSLIISYQNKIGNYNFHSTFISVFSIISYQNTIGNYNQQDLIQIENLNILYQRIIR